jgi:hypothetical protein
MAPLTRSLSAAIGSDTLVKVLKSDKTHHGHTYHLGRNDCTQPFNENHEDGGLYGCRLKDLFKWISLYPDIDTVALIEIPEDAQVKWFDSKFKASSLVLKRFIPLLQALDLARQHGSDIHTDNDYTLRMASLNGQFPVVQYLVEHGANVHTALRGASIGGHLPVVQYLVEHGANIHADHDIALCSAVEYGHVHVVRYLLEKGANVHANKDEPLSWASANGCMPLVQLLLDAGACATDDALLKAALNGHPRIAYTLVRAGASVRGAFLPSDLYGTLKTGVATAAVVFGGTLALTMGLNALSQSLYSPTC